MVYQVINTGFPINNMCHTFRQYLSWTKLQTTFILEMSKSPGAISLRFVKILRPIPFISDLVIK